MGKKVAIVLGTRPEIIKMAELIRLLKERKGKEAMVVFTGQHYDYSLCQVFMDELGMPKADVNLGVSSGTSAYQAGEMVQKLEEFIGREGIGIVVAEGDTNSVLAAALASVYTGAEFAHVEAGLRSHDWRMPEERNRVIADALSSYAFAPTKGAVKNLKEEGLEKERLFLTGNTVVEAVKKGMEKAKGSGILERLGLEEEKYAVLTAHRQEYVDRKECLEELLKALEGISREIVFPAHPRAVKSLKKFRLWKKANSLEDLKIVEPVGYFDFLRLASGSRFLLSDSGGVQEEASVYKKYVVVMRDSTERPEILGKFGCLTGYDHRKIVKAVKGIERDYNAVKKRLHSLKCPFGDGKASQRIAEKVLEAAE